MEEEATSEVDELITDAVRVHPFRRMASRVDQLLVKVGKTN